MDKKTSQQIRLQMILKKYGNLELPINDLKPSLENLTYLKEPDHSKPDLRRHTDPQMGFEKGRRKDIQHFLIIR